MRLQRWSCLAAALLLTASPSLGSAQNVLTNGSFESSGPLDDPATYTAALNGWTSTNGTCGGASVMSRYVPSPAPSGSIYVPAENGSWVAYFANVGCQGQLTQSFTGVTGQQYVFTAFIHDVTDMNSPGPSTFSATLAGDPTFALTPITGNLSVWTPVSGTFTATGNPETLQLTGSWLYLDNVSVAAVTTPEPMSIALLGTGLVGLVPALRRKRSA